MKLLASWKKGVTHPVTYAGGISSEKTSGFWEKLPEDGLILPLGARWIFLAGRSVTMCSVRDMVLWFVNTMERVCEQFRNRLNKPVDSVKMKNGLIF